MSSGTNPTGISIAAVEVVFIAPVIARQAMFSMRAGSYSCIDVLLVIAWRFLLSGAIWQVVLKLGSSNTLAISSSTLGHYTTAACVIIGLITAT